MLNWPKEKWRKLYVRDTPGFASLSYLARALFFELLRKVDDEGELVCGREYVEEIAALVRWPVTQCHAASRELVAKEHVTLDESKVGVRMRVTNFVDAQTAVTSDSVRARNYRERKKAGVTQRHAASRSVTTRLEENRLEENIYLRAETGDDKKNQPKSRRHRLPDDWQPTDAHRAKAKERGIDCEAEAEAFRDYWHADGRVKLDWNKAFYTWMRNSRAKPQKERDIRFGVFQPDGTEVYEIEGGEF